ncbi:MAG: hypothetical protein GY713_04830, partial [Actinomycetia bacterium]|nr:hypothetical protein [Actinomycetes bacterium]
MIRHHLHLTHPLTRRGLAFGLLLAALVPAAADAGTFEAFGPREYWRDPSLGPTETEIFTETFSVTEPSLSYTLRVERVRANLADIFINGTQVVKRRDFIDAGGDVVEKTVSLWDVNLIELEMQADPDGLVTVTIFGPDDDSPTITAVVDPEPNANGWNDTPVTVSFDCSDVTSGIAVCPAAIYQDTEVDGRVISGQAVDLAGNTAEASVTVSVDLSLPSVSIGSPMDGAVVTMPTVEVTGNVSDAFSGLDSVTCNGDSASIDDPLPGMFTCTVDLYLGGNTITVEATDLAGNVATDSVTIVLDTADIIKQLVDDQAPVIVIDHPADGSQVAVTAVTAEATVT